MKMLSIVLGCLGFVLHAGALAACLSDSEAMALADHFDARTAAPTPQAMTEADGRCSRARLHAQLEKRHGPVIGYKVALTNPAIQRMLRADGPTWGRLYQGMLLADGAVVDAAFGPRATVEADLLVRVGSGAVNQATTLAQVLAALDQVIPFIELPDMLVAEPLKLTVESFGAINAGARLGVTGTPVPVPADAPGRAALLLALGEMTVLVSDGKGAELGRGRGSDLLGHPLNSVLWLVRALAAEGLALKPGDLLSLGSFPPVMPARPGRGVTVTYQGLPGAAPVSVRLR